MQIVKLNTSTKSYQVLVAARIEQLTEYTDLKNCLAVVDKAVESRWKQANLNCHSIFTEAGEDIKNLQFVETLYSSFLDQQVDKSSVILAVGGGALTDVVSFAAATYYRGIDCITVPTTLLAQVDASIGGKNGVNYAGIKNIIGCITQPKSVCCDLSFLNSLATKDISSGMAEVIKAAVIEDPELFDLIDKESQAVLNLNPAILEQVLYRAISVKAGIVSRDEHESSERMKLNFGHTIGHALEVALKIDHGQAVALGMLLESNLAFQLGICDQSVGQKILQVCQKYQLPVNTDFNSEQIFELMLHDKKRRADKINFALPLQIGQLQIFPLQTDEIKKHLSNLRFN